MKRAFTILELLVASSLLAMLVTILTMVFNQSSIAWRTGVAGVVDLDDVRTNIAEVRDEADNIYVWNGEVHRLIGLWDEHGQLRTRAWDVGSEKDSVLQAGYLRSKGPSPSGTENPALSEFTVISVGSPDAGGRVKTYSVNVMSAGPNRKFYDEDDIWSFPDEIRF